jgi:hypothetical protein
VKREKLRALEGQDAKEVILRGITKGHEHLFNDYFSKAPTYTDEQFH